jgi:RNA polymerase sigma-70 factor (ECF subfamily)
VVEDPQTAEGCPAARFNDLYRRHFAAVYSYVLRRCSMMDEAPDLVAQIFAVAWQAIGKVPDSPADILWLYGVGRRVMSQHRRGESRRLRLVRRAAQAGMVDDGGADTASGLDDPLEFLRDWRLRPREAELIRLLFWEDLTHAEAAAVLGCSTNAVAIRLHRTLRRLRRQAHLGENS